MRADTGLVRCVQPPLRCVAGASGLALARKGDTTGTLRFPRRLLSPGFVGELAAELLGENSLPLAIDSLLEGSATGALRFPIRGIDRVRMGVTAATHGRDVDETVPRAFGKLAAASRRT